jgi:hypothetical protein
MKGGLSPLPKTGPRVFYLLLRCGPAAIFRAISKIIIDSVKSQAFWAITHIAVKVGKIFPAFANSDPAEYIVFVLRTFLGSHSPPHCNPASVCAGVSANSMPVSGEVSAYNFFVEAAA